MRGRRDEGGPSRRRALRIHGVARDLDEELAFHFSETVEELVAGGITREEAEAEAHRRFGDESRYRAELEATDRLMEVRRQRRDLFGAAAQMFRYALRGVRRSPGLSAGIVLTLALGIGANATMFSTIDRLLLRAPDHIREPETLRRLIVERYDPSVGAWTAARFSYVEYTRLADAPFSERFAAYFGDGGVMGEGSETRQVRGWAVTGNYWDVLGVRPHLGRLFTEEDDRPGAEHVIVLGYNLWVRDFAGDASVIGRTVRLGSTPHTVLGVAPKGFTGAELLSTNVDYWRPLHPRFAGQGPPGPQWPIVHGVVRVEGDLSAARRLEEQAGVYLAASQGDGDRPPTDARVVLRSIVGPNPAESGGRRGGSADLSRDGAVALGLGAVSLLVLLIACANVANLLLARSLEQRREIALRLALGISRRRLIAQSLGEGFMMAGLGGAAALVLARWGGGTLQRVLLPGVAWGEAVTVRMLAVLLLIVVAAGMVCALLPALEASRSDPARVLKALPGSPGRSFVRLRSWLAMTQVALTVVLLAGAGLFLRSFERAQAMAPGSGDGHVLTMWPILGPGVAIDLSTPDTRLMFETVRGRLAGIPGIEAVAVSSDFVPFRYAGSTPPLRATGHDSIASPHGGMPYRFRVSPEYFGVLGLRIEAGRGIEPTDRRGSESVAVVSQTMSASLWPEGDALDQCLFMGASATCVRIVGVVSDTRVGSIDETTPFAYYLPYAQDDGGAPYLLVRTQVAPKQMEGVVQRRLAGLDDRVRAWVVEDFYGEIFGAHVSSWKLGSTLFAGFGLLATVVAMVGLYAVLAFDVEQRRREIGVRTALGAGRDAIVRMFVRRATALTATGSVAGILLALVLAPRIQPLLFETSARDPLTFGSIAALLVLAGVAASGVPAWRAARIDPNRVLREE